VVEQYQKSSLQELGIISADKLHNGQFNKVLKISVALCLFQKPRSVSVGPLTVV